MKKNEYAIFIAFVLLLLLAVAAEPGIDYRVL